MKNNKQAQQLQYNDRSIALTIAGSDSGGGAGIAADLKTFSFYGMHGAAAITSVTAQNTTGVQNVHDLPPSMVGAQLESVFRDYDVDTVKTGMLSHAEIIQSVANVLEKEQPKYLVVDPVMVAASGDPLFNPEDKDVMRSRLFPLASVVTPNIREAEVLLNKSIKSEDDMEEAALEMSQLFNVDVILTGGHLGGDPTDVLATQGEIKRVPGSRIPRDTEHGSGCAYSASIAANLTREDNIHDCMKQAKSFVSEAIRWGCDEGEGPGNVEPGWGKFRAVEERTKKAELMGALDQLRQGSFARLIPEVNSNFACCISNATTLQDILAFPGRIASVNGQVRVHEAPQTGASRHVGSLLLKAHQYRSEIQSAINIRYAEELVKAAEDAGLETHEHLRDEEPEDVRKTEGASMPYVIESAFKLHGSIPDVIYDTGGRGKEAMIRIFGESPKDVAGKVQFLME